MSAITTLNVFSDGSWTVTSGIDAELEALHDDYVVSLTIAEILAAQGIEARQGGDGTAPREAREPGPKDAPKGQQLSNGGRNA